MESSKFSFRLELEDDTILNIRVFDGLTEKKQQSLDLNKVLGIDLNGHFVWGGTNFKRKARLSTMKIEDSYTLCADIEMPGWVGKYKTERIYLANYLEFKNGTVGFTQLPAAIAVKGEDALAKAALELSQKLKANTQLKVNKVQQDNDVTLWRIGVGTTINADDEIFTTLSQEASAVFLKAIAPTQSKIETLDIEVLKAKAAIGIGYIGNLPIPVPTYVGVEAGLNLFVAKASVFDVEFGIGVDTSIGINQSSFEAQVAGCGLVIGRRIGISLMGAKVAVDLGTFF